MWRLEFAEAFREPRRGALPNRIRRRQCSGAAGSFGERPHARSRGRRERIGLRAPCHGDLESRRRVVQMGDLVGEGALHFGCSLERCAVGGGARGCARGTAPFDTDQCGGILQQPFESRGDVYRRGPCGVRRAPRCEASSNRGWPGVAPCKREGSGGASSECSRFSGAESVRRAESRAHTRGYAGRAFRYFTRCRIPDTWFVFLFHSKKKVSCFLSIFSPAFFVR